MRGPWRYSRQYIRRYSRQGSKQYSRQDSKQYSQVQCSTMDRTTLTKRNMQHTLPKQ
jgi:hypothetical protein